jgi:hypothetical protein
MKIKKLGGKIMFNNSNGFVMPVAPTGYSGTTGGFGGFGSDWIGLIIILAILGWGGNGFGFGGFGGNGGYSEVQRGFDHNAVINKLDGLTYGLSDSTYALTNAINGGFNSVQASLCQGFNGVSREISDCCCATQGAIKDVRYDLATQACDTRHAIQDSTRQILDFLTTDKIATLQAENQSLKLAASQSNQNAVLMAAMDANKAEILRRTGAECPTAAYIVQPPTPVTFPQTCGCNGYGAYGYGNVVVGA